MVEVELWAALSGSLDAAQAKVQAYSGQASAAQAELLGAVRLQLAALNFALEAFGVELPHAPTGDNAHQLTTTFTASGKTHDWQKLCLPLKNQLVWCENCSIKQLVSDYDGTRYTSPDSGASSAGRVLCQVACDPIRRNSVRQAGGLPAILSMASGVGQSSPKGQSQSKENERGLALSALFNLSCDVTNQAAIRELGGIQDVVAIVQNHVSQLGPPGGGGGGGGSAPTASSRAASAAHADAACAVLWNLAADADNRVAVRMAGGVPPLAACLNHPRCELGLREKAAAVLWALAAEADTRAALLRGGVVPALVDELHGLCRQQGFLQKQKQQPPGVAFSAAVADKAAGALSSLAAGVECQVAMVQAGAIPVLRCVLQLGAVVGVGAGAGGQPSRGTCRSAKGGRRARAPKDGGGQEQEHAPVASAELRGLQQKAAAVLTHLAARSGWMGPATVLANAVLPHPHPQHHMQPQPQRHEAQTRSRRTPQH